ncbi:hypothetical protein BpHYR1_033412 [Brachionus plicatilis]|uniref:Uncharacterized protein n=1 Tax=Brachionus plicatilis TaxID=10195 RepID=A0A3M7R8N0_BRAPC|nr:hypothetical protein BpHYR1_033412 [Brachionus plicatilis]
MKNIQNISFQHFLLIAFLICLTYGSCYIINQKRPFRSGDSATHETSRKKQNDTRQYSSYAFLMSSMNSSPTNNQNRYLDLMEFLKDFWNVSINEANKKMSQSRECETNLKKEDGKNWTCKVKYTRSDTKNSATQTNRDNLIPLFCVCSYAYDCSKKELFYFSYGYMLRLLRDNARKKINRGADFQCEKVLRRETNKSWKCSIRKNSPNANNDPNEEYLCDCILIETCTHQRIVDFYS